MTARGGGILYQKGERLKTATLTQLDNDNSQESNAVIFRNTHRINSFSPTRTGLTALLSQRLCTRLAAGTVMTFI